MSWGGVLDLPLSGEGVSWPSRGGGSCRRRGCGDRVGGAPGRVARPPGRARPVREHGERPDLTNGTVLVTGGTGGLGVRVARWLTSLGPERVVLVSSRLLRYLSWRWSSPRRASRWRRCRVTSPTGSRCVSLVERIQATGAPLRGVVHVAGTVAEAGVAVTDRDAFEAVARVKIDGARHLHEATLGLDLALFVTFSSIAAAWGSGGQAAYAAGNATSTGWSPRARSGSGRYVGGVGPMGGGGMVDDDKAQPLERRA